MAIFITGGVGGSTTVTTTGQNSSTGGTTSTTYSSSAPKPSAPSSSNTSSSSGSSSSSSSSSSNSSSSSGGYNNTGYPTYAAWRNSQNDIDNAEFVATYGYAPRTSSEIQTAKAMNTTASTVSGTTTPTQGTERVPLTQAQVEQYQNLASQQESYTPLEQDSEGNYYYARGSEKEKMQAQEAKNLSQGYKMTSTTSSDKYVSPKQEELVYQSNLADLIFEGFVDVSQNKYTAYEDASGGVFLPVEYYAGVPETPLTSSQKGQLGYVDVGYASGPQQITILAPKGTPQYEVASSVVSKVPKGYGMSTPASGVFLVGPTVPQEKEVTQQTTALAEQTTSPTTTNLPIGQEGDVYASIESFYTEKSGVISLDTPRTDNATQLYDTVRVPDVSGMFIVQKGEAKPYTEVVPPTITYYNMGTGETSKSWEVPTNVYTVTDREGKTYRTTSLPVDPRIQADFDKALEAKQNPTGAVWINSPYEEQRYNEAQINKRIDELASPIYGVAESLRTETAKRWPIVGGVMGETTYGWVTALPETAKWGATSAYKMYEANPMVVGDTWRTFSERGEAGRQIFFEDTAVTGAGLAIGAGLAYGKFQTNPVGAIAEYGPIALVVIPRTVGSASFFLGAGATLETVGNLRNTIGGVEHGLTYERGFSRDIIKGGAMDYTVAEIYGPASDTTLTNPLGGWKQHEPVATVYGEPLQGGFYRKIIVPTDADSLMGTRTLIYEPATPGVDYKVWGTDINRIKDVTRAPITGLGIEQGPEAFRYPSAVQTQFGLDFTDDTYRNLLSTNYEVGEFFGGRFTPLDTRASAMNKIAGKYAWAGKEEMQTYAYTGYEFKGITSVDDFASGAWIQSTSKPDMFIAQVYQSEIGKGTYFYAGGTQYFGGDVGTFKGVASIMEAKNIRPVGTPYAGPVLTESTPSTFINMVGKQGTVTGQMGNLMLPPSPSMAGLMSGSGAGVTQAKSIVMPIGITSYKTSPMTQEYEDMFTDVKAFPSIQTISTPSTRQIENVVVRMPSITQRPFTVQESNVMIRPLTTPSFVEVQMPKFKPATQAREVQITNTQSELKITPIDITRVDTMPEVGWPTITSTGFGGGGGETPQPPKVPPMIPNLSMLDFGMGRREGHSFKQKTIYKPSYVGSGEAPGFERVMIGKAPKILTGGEIRGVVGKKKKKHKQKWYERM